MKTVLASESQSRKRALDILGVPYEVCPSEIDVITGIPLSALALFLRKFGVEM